MLPGQSAEITPIMSTTLKATLLPGFFVVLVLTIINITHTLHEQKPPPHLKRYNMFSLELVKKMQKHENQNKTRNILPFDPKEEEFFERLHQVQYFENISHDDMAIILYVRTHFDGPYEGIQQKIDSRPALVSIVDKLLKSKTHGYFLEYSTNDVENSKFFEVERNWTGLVIASDSEIYQRMLEEKRNVRSFKGCLSPSNYSETISLYEGKDKTTIQCFPASTFIRALAVKSIDYLSITAGGSELQILQTVPFEDVEINVISVNYMSPILNERILEGATKFLVGVGYTRAGEPVEGDVVFVRKDLDKS